MGITLCRRYAIEQSHEEAKAELGYDQCRERLWRGFSRQMVVENCNGEVFTQQLKRWIRS